MWKQWGLYRAFAFFLCVWNFGTWLVKGVYVSSPQLKACTESQPPWAEISHTWCCIFFAEEECVLCMIPHGRGRANSSLCMDTWIPPDAACAFPPYDQAMYPYHITITSLSPEHNCMLCPWELLANLNGVVTLGVSQYSHQWKCCIFLSYCRCCRLFWNFNYIDDCTCHQFT